MRSIQLGRLARLAPLAVCVSLLTGSAPRLPKSGSVLVVGVADGKTGAPLEGAQVRLPEIGRTAKANWIGEARFVDLSAGKYQVQVRHIGYAGSEVTVAVKGDTTGAVFMLDPIAVQVDTVRVEAMSVPVRMQNFENRRRMGIGHFLTDSVLAAEGSHELAYVLATRLPGLRTVGKQNELSIMALGVTGLIGDVQSVQSGLCPVDLYVDGFFRTSMDSAKQASAGPAKVYEIATRDVAGVELYSKAEAPAAYRRLGSACKVLLIWTKY